MFVNQNRSENWNKTTKLYDSQLKIVPRIGRIYNLDLAEQNQLSRLSLIGSDKNEYRRNTRSIRMTYLEPFQDKRIGIRREVDNDKWLEGMFFFLMMRTMWRKGMKNREHELSLRPLRDIGDAKGSNSRAVMEIDRHNTPVYKVI